MFLYDTERTNFTTGRTLHPLEHQSGSPDRGHGAAVSSAYQLSYRAPPGLMDYDHSLPASRLSSRPAAMGIGVLAYTVCRGRTGQCSPFTARTNCFYWCCLPKADMGCKHTQWVCVGATYMADSIHL